MSRTTPNRIRDTVINICSENIAYSLGYLCVTREIRNAAAVIHSSLESMVDRKNVFGMARHVYCAAMAIARVYPEERLEWIARRRALFVVYRYLYSESGLFRFFYKSLRLGWLVIKPIIRKYKVRNA